MQYATDCVIPAAGESKRFGVNKLVYPWKKATVLEEVLRTALQFCSRVFVVTGHAPEEVLPHIPGDPRVVVCQNDEYRFGMFSSIRTGLLRTTTSNVLVTMGDMPAIPEIVFASVLEAPEAAWVRPVFNGVPGHPVRIARRIVLELCGQNPKSGRMRAILDRYDGITVATESPGAYLDVDTKAELERLKGKTEEI